MALYDDEKIGEALTILDNECQHHFTCDLCPLYHKFSDDCLLSIFPARYKDKKFTRKMIYLGLKQYAEEHPDYKELLVFYKEHSSEK